MEGTYPGEMEVLIEGRGYFAGRGDGKFTDKAQTRVSAEQLVFNEEFSTYVETAFEVGSKL